MSTEILVNLEFTDTDDYFTNHHSVLVELTQDFTKTDDIFMAVIKSLGYIEYKRADYESGTYAWYTLEYTNPLRIPSQVYMITSFNLESFAEYPRLVI